MTDSQSSAERSKRSLLPLITAVAIGGLAVLTSWLGSLQFRIFVVLIVLLASREMALLVTREGAPVPEWGAPLAASLFAVFAASQGESGPITVGAGIVLWMLVLFVLGIFGVRSGKLRSIGSALLISFYVGMLGSFLIFIRLVAGHGTRLIAALVLIISAYQAGRILGEGSRGRSVTPALPEALGWRAVLFGVGASLAAGAISITFLKSPFTPANVLAIALIVGVSAVIGDLAGAMIRADSGISEREATVPGRGGFLLWLNPLLLGAPALFYSLRLYLT